MKFIKLFKPNWVIVSIVLLSQIIFCSFGLANIHQILEKSNEDYNDPIYFVVPQNELLNFFKIDKQWPLPSQKYDRLKFFGAWIRPNKNECLNTRGQVLKKFSNQPIQVNQNCTVISGEWSDRYTGSVFNNPQEVQIDHVVPLKHAYMAGAFEWDKYKRCLYTNYLGDSRHLIPVESRQNGLKSDKGPSEYLPPNLNYQCEYIKNIKAQNPNTISTSDKR